MKEIVRSYKISRQGKMSWLKNGSPSKRRKEFKFIWIQYKLMKRKGLVFKILLKDKIFNFRGFLGWGIKISYWFISLLPNCHQSWSTTTIKCLSWQAYQNIRIDFCFLLQAMLPYFLNISQFPNFYIIALKH